jgi:ubiquitin-protein ligase
MSIANKRILRDIHQVTSVSNTVLANAGIYYHADETSAFHGTALIVGQKGTPYCGGFYFFDITFPVDYPFSPLRVKSLTQDGKTRFNPNMYLDGKVCLSVLNTWIDGPPWTSVQSLESILMVLQADVLTASPLNNEPAYYNVGLNEDAKKYNRLIFHANLETAILQMIRSPPDFARPFLDTMHSVFQTILSELLEMVVTYATEYENVYEMFPIFTPPMATTYRFCALGEALSSLGL